MFPGKQIIHIWNLPRLFYATPLWLIFICLLILLRIITAKETDQNDVVHGNETSPHYMKTVRAFKSLTGEHRGQTTQAVTENKGGTSCLPLTQGADAESWASSDLSGRQSH